MQHHDSHLNISLDRVRRRGPRIPKPSYPALSALPQVYTTHHSYLPTRTTPQSAPNPTSISFTVMPARQPEPRSNANHVPVPYYLGINTPISLAVTIKPTALLLSTHLHPALCPHRPMTIRRSRHRLLVGPCMPRYRRCVTNQYRALSSCIAGGRDCKWFI